MSNLLNKVEIVCENCGRIATEHFEDGGMTYDLCYFCFTYVPMGELATKQKEHGR